MQQEQGSRIVQIAHPANVGSARRAARSLARDLGYDSQTCEAIALAATELATNLLKHAGGGELILRIIREAEQIGLQLESRDKGPGISDVELAISDGYSTAGSRGVGLGAVNRLMDEFNVSSRPGAGTKITCCKWLKTGRASLRACPLDIGIASRARRLADPNADSFVLKHSPHHILAGVIDGRVHGLKGHQAALSARTYIETHSNLSLDRILLGTQRTCGGSCIDLALICINWMKNQVWLSSKGSVQIRAHSSAHLHQCPLPLQRTRRVGTTTAVAQCQWSSGTILIIHSDGVSSDWCWQDFPELGQQPSTNAARDLLSQLAIPEEDATIIVIKNRLSSTSEAFKTSKGIVR